MIATSSWGARISNDAVRAYVCQTREQRAVTDELLRRARAAGAQALALTGSTVRHQRTRISDLDYHLIGSRLHLTDLTGELDVVTDSEERFFERLFTGDDFAQWTLRFGCVLLDDGGLLRRGWELVQREDLWPDADARLDRSLTLSGLAAKVLSIDDEEAGQEHVRAALTAAARGMLLARQIFPLARAELPTQLCEIGEEDLGHALDRSIHEDLTLAELGGYLDLLRNRLEGRTSIASAGSR